MNQCEFTDYMKGNNQTGKWMDLKINKGKTYQTGKGLEMYRIKRQASIRIKRNGNDQNLREVKCCNVQTGKWMM